MTPGSSPESSSFRIRGGLRGQGDRGEEAARLHLESVGYVLLDRGWTCRSGELDLVMRAPDGTIAIVEVKTAYRDSAGDPAGWITASKRRRLSRAALEWLVAHDSMDHPARFDLVSIAPDRSILHIADAFPFEE